MSSPAFNACLHEGAGQEERPDLYKKSIGYAMTIVSVLLSGFVTIYFEKVVKSKTEVITIWERNFQLCFYSMLFCLLMNIHTLAQHSTNAESYTPLSGWSTLTLLVAVLGAGNGLIVAATLKHADSILKVLAQAGAIVISTGLGFLLQGEPLDAFVAIGCLVAILSIMNYSLDSTPPPAPGGAEDTGDKC